MVGFSVDLVSVNNGTLVRAAVHEQFMLSKSIVFVQREFRRKFGDDRQRGAAPSRKIIGKWEHQ